VNLKSKLPPRFQKYVSFGVFPKILLAPVAFLILIAFLLAKPFVQIRLYRMVDSRLGHLTVNTEVVRLQNLEHNLVTKKREVIVYCSENWNCSNNSMRNLFFRDNYHLRGALAWLAVWMSNNVTIFYSLKSVANRDLLIDKTGYFVKNLPNLIFSDCELKVGENFLDLVNTSINNFVCLNVRDSAYLSKKMGVHSSKHDFRDANIESYLAAAESLAELGYTVFRMGAIVKSPLVSKHPRVIDYATNGMRTEFLDVYLGATCRFSISAGSGWDGIPTIFRRPIMFVNHLPIFAPYALTIPVFIHPKSLVDGISGDFLPISDLVCRKIADRQNTRAYADAGVEIRDLSSEELVEAVTEMAQRVEGTFVETPEQKELQAKLKHILSTHPKLQPTPNYYPIRAEFASCFLSRYPNFLD